MATLSAGGALVVVPCRNAYSHVGGQSRLLRAEARSARPAVEQTAHSLERCLDRQQWEFHTVQRRRRNCLQPQRIIRTHSHGGAYSSLSGGNSLSSALNREERIEDAGEEEKLQLKKMTGTAADVMGKLKLEASGRLQSTQETLQNLDIKQLSADVWNLCDERIRSWWKSTAPWYKWPVAVFIPLFLFLRLRFGSAVVGDLAPLWLLGPFFLSFTVWLSITILRGSRRAITVTAQTSLLLASKSAELYEYAQTGKLAEDARALSSAKRAELEEKGQQLLLLTSGKKDSLVKYVESGQLALDAKEQAVQIAKRRVALLEEWAVRTSEDFIDWWRPTRRRLLKLLQKIF